MNILLDTHIVLWWLNNDEKLLETHREIISNTDNLSFISAATIWELSIKIKLGKLKIVDNYIDELQQESFFELPISWFHANQVKNLPLIHKDPFDRLLIAQAQIEEMTLLSVDQNIKQYDVRVL